MSQDFYSITVTNLDHCISQDSTEKQSQWEYTQKDSYDEELAHVILEAEKSHYLQSAPWRPIITGDIVPSKV